MRNRPLVSVVVPVYNVEKYVEKCLNSLTRQDYKRIEIIVVNDGSTDKSGEICERIAKLDRRVKVLHQNNKGLSGARNAGIKMAKGEFICLVDSDDYVENDFVSKMVRKSEGGADLIICGYNNEIPDNVTQTGRKVTIKLLTKQRNMEIVAWNKMYRRELFGGIEYPVGQNYEDTLTTYKILFRARKISYVPESLYVYVERDESITSRDKKEEKLLAREKAAKEAIRYFDDDKEMKQAAEISLLTAELAFADFAISGQIGRKYFGNSLSYVQKNKDKLLKNRFMTLKLKIYIKLMTRWNGRWYWLFRKIRHE